MKALAVINRFEIENLRWIDLDEPRPGWGEVLVRIKAVALNFRDLQIVEGGRNLAFPLIPLSDAAGVVAGVGDGVTRFAAGDRVMPVFAQGWVSGPPPAADVLPTLGGPLPGVCRPYAVWPQTELVPSPEHLSDLEAATLPCAGVSAWNALFDAANIHAGATPVLLQGTGGVATFALQFAKLAGARVIVVSDKSTRRSHEPGRWGPMTRSTTGVIRNGDPLHAISRKTVWIASSRSAARTLGQSIAALRNGGNISYVGFLSGTRPDFDLGELSRKSIRLTGIRVGNRDSFERMCRAITDANAPGDEFGVRSSRPAGGAHASLSRPATSARLRFTAPRTVERKTKVTVSGRLLHAMLHVANLDRSVTSTFASSA